MTTFTPESIIYPSSSHVADILVSGRDENGVLTNVTVTDAALAEQLASTPTTIPNPAYQPLADKAMTKAAELVAANAKGAANG